MLGHRLLGSDSKIESTDLSSIGVENVNTIPSLGFVDHVRVLSYHINVVLDSLAVTASKGLRTSDNHGKVRGVESFAEGVVSFGYFS